MRKLSTLFALAAVLVVATPVHAAELERFDEAGLVLADATPVLEAAPAPTAPVAPNAEQPAKFVHPTAEEFLARGALTSLLVGISVRVMRGLFPDQLAPQPSTLTSRRLVIGVCLVSGVALGLAGLAPAVAAGWPGPIMGGLGAGGLAYVTAGASGSKARLEKQGPPTDTV